MNTLSFTGDMARLQQANQESHDPPYGDGEFDDVFAVQVLEYMIDLDAALSQIHRMLRPGGAAGRRGDGLEFGGVAFRKCAAYAASSDRMGAT